MNVISLDRRAEHYVESKTRSLGRLMDISTLASESRAYLQQAHEAHITDNWKTYLDAIAGINDHLVDIRRRCSQWSGEIETAPVIPKDQLAFWTAA